MTQCFGPSTRSLTLPSAVIQDKLGIQAANLPTPDYEIRSGFSSGGIQSIQLKSAPSAKSANLPTTDSGGKIWLLPDGIRSGSVKLRTP